ncbi:hypothetical protein CYPRO_1646 [Cyclonatronum proteinivorum]|uniref:Uncharacterized protein n=1 Tax=Cyclonatronum proteinivorum TaxID=1457365 RepID=A0A345UK95_9BACT|nr:hypothetical protein CYPRO_1646 [Cyclonatronum proteinivorum]
MIFCLPSSVRPLSAVCRPKKSNAFIFDLGSLKLPRKTVMFSEFPPKKTQAGTAWVLSRLFGRLELIYLLTGRGSGVADEIALIAALRFHKHGCCKRGQAYGAFTRNFSGACDPIGTAYE